MKGSGKALMIFYQALSTIILPILFFYILWRKIKSKESKERYLERFAITSQIPPQNCKLLWVHAVSVGESNSAWVLIEELLNFSENIKILFTSTSITSAQIIDQK
ncbi:MAG: 3-deoxy-D-manno-octulosonic acid transferase, partial [Proteobacteria bacterium]|nr:3-deoxy-D-manno-octulosonic acid transferase [Pseudomonadota bacterium]